MRFLRRRVESHERRRERHGDVAHVRDVRPRRVVQLVRRRAFESFPVQPREERGGRTRRRRRRRRVMVMMLLT